VVCRDRKCNLGAGRLWHAACPAIAAGEAALPADFPSAVWSRPLPTACGLRPPGTSGDGGTAHPEHALTTEDIGQ